MAHCTAHPNLCEYTTMASAFGWNVFSIMSKVNDAKALIYSPEFPAHTGTEIYPQTYRLGYDLGYVLKLLIAYK